MPDKKSVVYRVRGLPPDCTNTQLIEALIPYLTEEEKACFNPQIAIVPSCYHGDPTATAFLALNTAPSFLSKLNQNPLMDWQLEVELGGTDDINFDRHFHGLTQLYAVEGQTIRAE